MNRTVLSIVTATLLATSFSGCGSTPAPVPTPAPKVVSTPVVANNFPAWIDDIGSVGGVAAVGEAKIGPAGRGFAKTEATANARDDIARQLNVKVKNMVENFTQTTGVGDAQTVDKVVKNISKQVAKVDLTGSKVTKTFTDRTNNILYVLVKLDPASVAVAQKAMKEAVVSSYKNDEALYAQFLAKKGSEALDAEIDKEFGARK